ncbi:lysostaphin resistance A-like protein [Fontivita pretiosa]|uniref:CPBP family intramembrane glutamic endopeptidase n=1 Tax=Fontivita pretiosa TaxID=2989684 RepID=UPI003D17EC5C
MPILFPRILAQTQPTSDQEPLMLMLVLAAGGLLLAGAVGAFRARSIVGPPRLAPGERLAPLWEVLLIGLATWFASQVFYASLVGGGEHQAPAAPSTAATTTPATAPPVSLSPRQLVILTVFAPTLAVIALCAGTATLRPGGLRRLGLGAHDAVRARTAGALGAAVILPLTYLSAWLTQLLWQWLGLEHPQAHQLLQQLRDSPDPLLRILIVVSAVLVAPAFEEIFFRGHLQTATLYTLFRRPDMPVARWTAVLLSSLVFASVHEWWTRPPIFFLSLCLGYAYERTGNLWVPILIHAAFNAANVIIVLMHLA